MAQTAIEWTWRRTRRELLTMSQLAFALECGAVAHGEEVILPGFTFNPWIGCTKVSPGCLHCYAAELDERRFSKTLGEATKEKPIIHWGKGAPRWRTSTATWRNPLRWDAWAQQLGIRLRVFSASLADWLDDEVPLAWLADFLAVVAATPHLDWLLVTKRPENWRTRLEEIVTSAHVSLDAMLFANAWLGGHVPSNVWFIVTTEDQDRADLRIPLALDIPAVVHGASAEPLLTGIDFTRLDVGDGNTLNALTGTYYVEGRGAVEHASKARLNWVIAGGESGDDDMTPSGAIISAIRGFDLAWARGIRDQVTGAGARFFMKQAGARPFDSSINGMATLHPDNRLYYRDGKGGDSSEWPADLRIQEYPVTEGVAA